MPMARSEASHMISNDLIQLGAEMIGADISSYLSFSHDLKYPSSKSKGSSFASRLVKGLAILLKSLINRRQNPTCPKKNQISLMHLGGGSLAITSILDLSTPIPLLEISWPKTILRLTMK